MVVDAVGPKLNWQEHRNKYLPCPFILYKDKLIPWRDKIADHKHPPAMKVPPPTSINQYVARRLREARLDKQYCQAYLATEAGLCQSGYSALENGKRDIALGQLEKLAQVLGKGILDFLPPSSGPVVAKPKK
jgi:DNA-binding XRE family transcriptional regulator